jgi:putative transposase
LAPDLTEPSERGRDRPLIGALLLEANDEWQLQHRYMQTEAMAELTPPLLDAVPTQTATVAA